MRYIFKIFKINAKTHIINQSKVLKILGTYISNDLSLDNEIGKLWATLHNRVQRVYNLNKLNQYTNFHTRLQFMNGYVIGKL